MVSFLKLRIHHHLLHHPYVFSTPNRGGLKKTHETHRSKSRFDFGSGNSAKRKSEFLVPSSLRSQLGIHTFSALGIFFGTVSFLGSFLFQKKISAKLSLVSWKLESLDVETC